MIMMKVLFDLENIIFLIENLGPELQLGPYSLGSIMDCE
jgi:hypothetical protein